VNGQSMKWQRFTPKFPLPIPFFSRSPYITILNTGAHYMLVRNVNFNCNCFSPPPALMHLSQNKPAVFCGEIKIDTIDLHES
jgi:hypothetical protein